MIDRSKAPETNNQFDIDFRPFLKENIGDIPFYFQSNGSQEVIKLELVFSYSLFNQPTIGASTFMSGMLSEGTIKRDGKTLLNELDFYGSYFQVKASEKDSTATLFCLSRHLHSCLPLFIEALTESIFPVTSLELLKQNAAERFKINETKNNYICRTEYNKNFFGLTHPFGKANSLEIIAATKRDELFAYYQNKLINGLKYILLSGLFKESERLLVINTIKNSAFTNHNTKLIENSEPISTPGDYNVLNPKSKQLSLKFGKKGVARKSPDFPKFQLMNMILGGYFGSRLMKNIREEKGLTYGIYSIHDALPGNENWYIETDINEKKAQIGIKEIWAEIKRLKENQVSNEELKMARNYLLGGILKSLDNNLSLSSRMKMQIDNELEENYLSNFVEQIKSVQAKDIMEIANKHLIEEEFVKVTVSKF